MARKTKYNSDTFPKLAEMHARDGLIDIDIARKLDISIQTFYTYQNKYVEFFDAIKKGKAPVDFEVENALLKRALGYDYDEKTIEYINKEGKPEIKGTKTIKKQVAPDVTAQIFWLKNRRPKFWKDRNHTDITTDGEKINQETTVTFINAKRNKE